MTNPPVALLGLGLMGSGMASNLLSAGHPLSVYNRSSARAQPFADAGARVARSPREAAEGADIILSIVADDAASRAIWFGEDGALAGAAPGTLLIESSTVSVEWVRELAAAAQERGLELLDAPVTGSKPQAAAGQLRFLVGGSPAALERARPVLATMGHEIVHIGPSGSGALIKLINNFMCGVQTASLAEAIALIEASGLDRDRAIDVLTTGAPGSPMVKTLAPRMVEREYTPQFVLRLLLKDLTYAAAEGAERGIPLATAAAARDVCQRAVDAGFGERDMSAVVEQFRGEG